MGVYGLLWTPSMLHWTSLKITEKTGQDSMKTKERDGYVFISYKREESDYAEQIRNALSDSGFEVWWDEDIQCGQVWNEVLDRAVQEASCIVVLWSEMSTNSRWVMHEALIAIAHEIYTPVRIELSTINPPYNRFQASDILNWDGSPLHPGFIDLLNRVDVLIPQKKTFLTKAVNWLKSKVIVIVSVVFAFLAIGILLWQTSATNVQLQKMEQLVGEQKILSEAIKLQTMSATPFHIMRFILYFDENVSEKELTSASDIRVNINFQRHNSTEVQLSAWPINWHRRLSKKVRRIAEVGPYIAISAGEGYKIPLFRENISVLFPREQEVFGYKSVSFWIRVRRSEVEQKGKKYWPYLVMSDFKNVGLDLNVAGAFANKLEAVKLWFNEDEYAITVPMRTSKPDPNVPDSTLGKNAHGHIADIFEQLLVTAKASHESTKHTHPPTKIK